MNTFTELLHFWQAQADKLGQQTLQHIGLTAASLLLGVLLGVPLGLLVTRRPRLAPWVLGTASILQTIPSIALLGFLIPLLGIGPGPAIFALFLYALLPIVRNTVTGIQGVDAAVVDAGRGLGFTDAQVLRRIELPLALPVLFAGIRTAAVINVGVATLAAYIAAGGLGEFIFGGIALNNPAMILAGAIPAAALALAFDAALAGLQRLPVRRLLRVGQSLLLILPLLAGLYLLPRATSRLLAGFSPEFVGRADGLPGLQQKYGLQTASVVLAPALVYEAARHGDVDVIDGYSTDGRIRAYDLRVLRDDQQAFPPYQAVPVVRAGALQEHPELAAVLAKLDGQISDSVMTELNYRVDYLHETPRAVAQAFLRQRGLWHNALPVTGGTIRLGSKIFAEQYILAEMYAALIRGYTGLEVESKTGLGGTNICFEALRTGAIDLYPEYTGTGLLVLLQPPTAVVDSLGGQPAAVLAYVQREFRRRYQLEWLAPLGFNNTYALLMRRQQAEKLGIASVSELSAFLRN
ncbi:osmoprotectant transport system permease protein [Hymenobacter gelipurpurascens]|uniref:Osmoprotectant transport system permease protein n=1 Tax=Hymenobacter gelipurpurascens TaxID=89968 RepID=A0A212TDF8_9BACT|nr:glycine betaine ABC transporter substrate-binding protein [Hymenobacter gelipurpurascens]SNC63866.1 osmoprotectant transport system permease protein [Hymenobacter gelipurpurascens]